VGPYQISHLSGQKYGNTAPKIVNILNFCHKFALRGHLFAQFFKRNSRFLYPSIGQVVLKFLIWLLSGDKQASCKHFSVVGAFSLKFSKAPSGKTTDRIKKKLGGAKMGRISSITMPSMVGIVDRALAVDEKV